MNIIDELMTAAKRRAEIYQKLTQSIENEVGSLNFSQTQALADEIVSILPLCEIEKWLSNKEQK